MRCHRLAAVATATLLAGANIPHSAAAPPVDGGPYRVQLISRTKASLAPFRLSIIASSDNDFGMWTLLQLERDGKRWKQDPSGIGGYTTITGTPFPSVYGTPGPPLPSCPDMPGCSYPVPFDGSRSYDATPQAMTRYYVISAHASVRIELNTKGWRVSEVRGLSARRVLAPNATALGAGAMGRHVEHFTTATTSGGRYGSAVFADVPCEGGGTGSARLTGRGAIDITGDREPRPLECRPTSGVLSYNFAYSPVQTSWTLTGDVKGIGYNITRLFVFDFPKP